MRTTNNMLVNNMLYYMNNNLDRMSKYQSQMANGKKIEVPSDDPIVAARALKFRTDVSEIGQFKSNSNDAYSWMDISEVALSKLGDILHVSGERAVQVANGTMTPSDRDKIKQEISQLKSQVIHLANSSYAGRYVFSGYMTDSKLMNEDGSYECSVSSKEMIAFKSGLIDLTNNPIDSTTKNNFDISFDGKNYYKLTIPPGIVYDGTAGKKLDDLAKAIQQALPLATPIAPAPAIPAQFNNMKVTANNGRIEFTLDDVTDAAGNKVSLFLQNSITNNLLGEINIKTEGAPGVAISKAEDVKYQMGIGDLLNVNVPGSELFGAGAAGQISKFVDNFDNFIDALGNSSYIASEGVFVNYSNPLDLTAKNQFSVTINGVTQAITLTPQVYDGSAGNTMGNVAVDMQTKINTAFGGTANVIVTNRSGKLIVSEKSGKTVTLTAAALSANDALSALNFSMTGINAVGKTSSQGIEESISNLQTLLDKVLSVRADIGARMNRVELTQNRLDSDEINFTKLMSDNENADMAEVIMRLQNEENVYKASLAGGARIIQPSLVDFLR